MESCRMANLLPASAGQLGGSRELYLYPLRIPDPHDLRALLLAPNPALLITEQGLPLAWTDCRGPSGATSVLVAGEGVVSLQFPWEALAWHDQLLPGLQENVCGRIHPAAIIEGTLQLGEGSVILPGTVIEGAVSIGRNCRIGPHALLRGCVTVGDGCVVGHAVELKNCILGKGTNLAHLSYAGDSLLGDEVNVGGGSILSNYRHDAAEHRMNIAGKLMKTGRTKLGCVIGDHARLGANTTVLPGRIIEAGATTWPGSVVR